MSESTVTMLRSARGKALVKSFDGESWQSYDNEKYFFAREELLLCLEHWVDLLRSVASNSDVALVRGNVLSSEQRPEFYTDANGKQSRVTLSSGAVARHNDVIEDTAKNWVVFDVDAFEPFLYKPTEPGAIQEWIAAALPAEFQSTRFVYQFSNTAGFKGNQLKCHVFFQLSTPYTCNELRQWARAKKLDVDPISFKQAQLIYTGNPKLAENVADPVPQRIGISYEGKRDSVPLVIDEAVLAQAHERDANRGPGLTDAREKPGYIGAFCRAHEPDELIDGILSEYFEWLDYDTGKLNYLAGASGAKRGAFLSSDRQRITNMHGSAGFKQHSPLNSFDAVRYYALGGIDADEADFDANRDDSYQRILELCKGDARIQAEMMKEVEGFFDPIPGAPDHPEPDFNMAGRQNDEDSAPAPAVTGVAPGSHDAETAEKTENNGQGGGAEISGSRGKLDDGGMIDMAAVRAYDVVGAINKRLKRLAGKDHPKPSFKVLHRILSSTFFSGERSKFFILTKDGSLNQFVEAKAMRHIGMSFSSFLDWQALFDAMADIDPELDEKKETAVRKEINDIILADIMQYAQRNSLEFRVDMFGEENRMEINEDKARIVLCHKPFPEFVPGFGSEYDEAVVADFKEHFPMLDEFLRFLVMSRFAGDRKKAFVWLKADSDWGKGFFIGGILGELGLTVNTHVKEVEAIFEGRPVGKSPLDFKRSFALVIDEFKTVKAEIKMLQNNLALAPKNQLTSEVELFAKVFMSAEDVDALATEVGVEEQFMNRFSYIEGEGVLPARKLFREVGKTRYRASVQLYVAQFMNELVSEMLPFGRIDAASRADGWLDEFQERYGLRKQYESVGDNLERIAQDIVNSLDLDETFTDGNAVFNAEDGYYYLKRADKLIDDYIYDNFSRSTAPTLRKKKSDLRNFMSADGAGIRERRVNGAKAKFIKLKPQT